MFVCTAPFLITTIAKGRWAFGKCLCDFYGITIYALTTVSLYLMALIAINRFFCVVRPSRYNSIFTCKTIIFCIVITWATVFSFLLVLHLAGWLEVYFHPYKAICVPYLNLKTPQAMFAANILSGIIMVGVPVLILSFCYLRIFINV